MPSSANIVSLFLDQVQAQPEAIVIRVPQRSLGGSLRYASYSFGDLNSKVDATAHYLLNKGILPGYRVLLMLKPSLEWLQLVFALFKIGAVPILLDPGLGLKSYLKSIQHSTVDAIIGIAKGIVLSHLCPKAFPALKKRIWVSYSFQKTIQTYFKKGPFDIYPSLPEDLAAILFTSGSTGAPKGVSYQHRHFRAQVEAVRSTYRIEPGTIDLPLLAIFILFNPVLGSVSILPEIDASQPAQLKPDRIVQAIRENGVQSSFGSPALWAKIGEYCLSKKLTLPTVKRILIAGTALNPGLLRQLKSILPNGEVHMPYGATECLPISTVDGKTVLEKEPSKAVFAGTCLGKPVAGVTIAIIAPQEGCISHFKEAVLLDPGAVGEIIVQGPMVTEQYDHLACATALAKIPDGNGFWHRMGDLGYIDADGFLWFCGRKVEAVKTTHGLLYAEPCERIFRDDPRIHRVALIALGPEGKSAALVVEPKKGYFPKNTVERLAFSQELLRLAKRYPTSQAIEAVFFEKSLPVDVRHNAKIHRLKLRQKYEH